MDNRNVEIVINAKDNASATLGKLTGELKSFGGNATKFLGNAVQAASQVAVAGLTAVGAGAALSVKAFMESENAVAQMNAVLKSTKNAAGMSAESLQNMAGELQKVTKFGDEAIMGGQNMLLTFTNIGKDVFPQATETMLDMSQALGQDLKSSSIQLGKALQDPVQGVTALKRVGVNFTDSQKEMIQKMVDAGDVMGAQKFILKELQTEFGGSARAAGETFAGKLEILKNQFGELQEKAGGFLVKALTPLVSKLLEFINAIDFAAVLDKVKSKFTEVAGSIKPFIDPLVNFIKQHKESILDFLKTFGISLAIIIPILALVGGAIMVLSNPLVQIGLVVAALIAVWKLFGDNITAFYNSAIVPLWQWLVGMLQPSLEALGNTILTRLWPAIKQLWDALNPGLMTAIKIIAAALGILIVAAIWLFINALNIAISVASWFIAVISNIIRWLGTLVATVAGAVGAIIGWFSRLPGNIANIVGSIQAWFAQLPDRIMGAISSLGGKFVNFFSSIGQGAKNAVVGAIDGIGGAVRAPVNFVIDKVNGLINSFNKLPGPDIPNIPRLATGTQFFKGGLAMVGENGPELVQMPRGARVMNAQETQSVNTTASFYGDIHLGDSSAVREFFDKFGRNQELAQQGLTTVRY